MIVAVNLSRLSACLSRNCLNLVCNQLTVYSTYSDNELFVLIGQHNEAAYKELYQRYWYLLYKHARKMLQEDEAAKDVVQDVFTKLWALAPELRIYTTVSGYLYTATRNKILNIFEKSRLKEAYASTLLNETLNSESTTDHLLRDRELAVLIEMEITRLPDKMRRVFELSRKGNLSHQQIAEQLDIAPNTVKKQVANAIKILRLKLGLLFYLLSLCLAPAGYLGLCSFMS
jgi:RNA polymerase sigma-70 factor (family 1)